jgi:hypothetical protein
MRVGGRCASFWGSPACCVRAGSSGPSGLCRRRPRAAWRCSAWGRRAVVGRPVGCCCNQRDASHAIGEVMMASDCTTISAKIYLLRPEEGGRKTPLFTGYRAAVYFGDCQTDGRIVFHGTDQPALGGESTVMMAFAHPAYLGDALRQAATFDVREGPNIIGRGTVLTVEAAKKCAGHHLPEPHTCTGGQWVLQSGVSRRGRRPCRTKCSSW